VVCTGETVQVFLDTKGDLCLNLPPFFEEWKRKVGLLK
jgi:acyl-CoA thioester hydrolase